MASPRAQQYYRPYLASDSEFSDSDNESALSDWSRPSTPTRPSNAGDDLKVIDSELSLADVGPDFAKLARGLQATAGPTFPTDKVQDRYGVNHLQHHQNYSPYDIVDMSGEKIKMTVKDTATVVMLRSQDRDRSVFSQPTDCQLFLPRIYKNIQSFSVVQVNLTSAFFYFRANKENIKIQIYEKGRVVYETILAPPASTTPLKPIATIREGSYNITQLLAEIQTQLNRTPLFYDFLNGFSDFYAAFTINGDYSVNFNYPGDTYYDAVKKVFVNNPTRAQITTYYFQSQNANQVSFTIEQVKVAYYYPIIKEALLDPTTNLVLWNLTAIDPTTGLPFTSNDECIQYLVYSFTGLNDPVAQTIINQNTALLDEYRLLHTFRYSLVNRYECLVNTTNNRITIQSTTLNTSLLNLLNTQYNIYYAQQLAKYSLTNAQYLSKVLNLNNLQSILQSMYNYLNYQFAYYFAVDYGTYTRGYFANMSNSVLVRNGLDASGVALSFNLDTISTPRDTDYLNDFKTNPPYYWNKMSNIGNPQYYSTNMGETPSTGIIEYPSTLNYPYVLTQSNVDLTRPFVDLSGQVYTDSRRRAGDVLVNIEPSKYTIFRFRSKYRQTLQVESLMRQTNYRYSNWNKNNIVPYPVSSIFDISYSYVMPAGLSNSVLYDVSYNTIPGWSNILGTASNFGIDYQSSINYWTGSSLYINTTLNSGVYFELPTPLAQPRSGPSDSNTYTYPFAFSVRSPSVSGFDSDLVGFLYHDIAAHHADISGVRHESPFFYKSTFLMQGGAQSTTVNFQAYGNQTYYLTIRPVTETPTFTQFQVVPYFSTSTYTTLSTNTNFNNLADPDTLLTNYNVAINNDPAYIRLPLYSTLWANTSPSNDFVNSITLSAATPIGYDRKGVSTDLTDYIAFQTIATSSILPTATLRADPITNYLFQCNSPYDTNTDSYFYPSSLNAIFTSNTNAQYTPSTVAYRQYKMVNWYSPTFLHDPITNHPWTSNDISPYIQPYTVSTTSTAIAGYNYDVQSQLILGNGVTGFTFLPGDGTWFVDRITYKTNFLTRNPAKNTNEAVQFLGVFLTADVLGRSVSAVSPPNALAICMLQSASLYSTSALNLGFDASLGTYYTYSNVSSLVLNSNATTLMSGYSQIKKQLIPDSNSYYSVIGFSGIPGTTISSFYSTNPSTVSTSVSEIRNLISANNVHITPIVNMTGSAIPYPYANQAFPSTTFYDNQVSPKPGYDLVRSTNGGNSTIYGPQGMNDESVAQYEQSIPYVNSHMHYLTKQDIVTDLSGFSIWTSSLTNATTIQTNVANYMLFQDGNFTILPYKFYTDATSLDPALRTFSNANPISLTIDMIYPLYESTSLLAVSGRTDAYVFLGSSNGVLRFKTYDPASGTLTELPKNPNYQLPASNFFIQNFVFHNTNRWFVTGFNTSNSRLQLYGDTTYTSTTNTMFSTTFTAGFSNSVVHMDPSGQFLYWMQQVSTTQLASTLNLYSFDASDTTGYIRTGSGYTINLQTYNVITAPDLPNGYTDYLVTLNSGNEEVLLASPQEAPAKYYKIQGYLPSTTTQSNTSIVSSAQILKDSTDTPVSATKLFGGYSGSKWLFFSGMDPYIMGNRNDSYDAPQSVDIAYQIFFPTTKIELRKLTTGSSPITDLTGLNYPEWPHTMMFGYSNYTNLSNDIFSSGGKWGLESSSNFFVSDVSFNGFYFNSYLMNFPLYNNSTAPDSNTNQDYYLAVRGFTPTERFQTMLRFYMPNRYDFGFLTFKDLSGEPILASTIPNEFNPTYLEALLRFNSTFQFSATNFGSNALQGYTGSNISSVGFGDFMRQYINVNSTFVTDSVIVQDVQSTTTALINSFIATDLKYILPANALNRQRYTDPILFQILWKSQLSPNFLTLEDEWGLGWNLGYNKVDTSFATVHTGSSFFKIQQDFIYLRLNREFNINRMDAGGKEDYKQGRESTGTTDQYYCKLLLTNFGGNATTFIHNPVTFNPPLARLTKLSFQWLFPNGQVIDNGDAEWNLTVNVTERVEIPSIPDKMPFTPADPKTGKPAKLPSNYFDPPKMQEEGKALKAKDEKAFATEKAQLAETAFKERAAKGNLRTRSSSISSVSSTSSTSSR